MRTEHQSIDYPTEKALLGRIIYEAFSLSNEIIATRADYYQVVLRIKNTKASNEIISTITNKFKGEHCFLRIKRINYDLIKKKEDDFFEIIINIKNGFQKHVETKSYVSKKFDELISTIQSLLNTKKRENINDFLTQTDCLPKLFGNDINNIFYIITASLNHIDDRNEFLVFTEYLWKSKAGSLFGYDFNQMENIWENRSLLLEN